MTTESFSAEERSRMDDYARKMRDDGHNGSANYYTGGWECYSSCAACDDLTLDFNPLEIEICRDCFDYAIAAMYSDFSGIEEDVVERLEGKVPELFSVGDRVNEFSRAICDSCGSRLAGERFGAILAE